MSRMRMALMGVGGVVGLGVIAVGGGMAWAVSASNAVLARTFEAHTVDFPTPMPLTEAEIATLKAEKLAQMATPADGSVATDAAEAAAPSDPLEGVDLDAIAMERALARGKHLVEARYVCIECHGADFGGGTMIDAPPMGKVLGPNLTSGKGSATVNYTKADWDRIVRHGIKPDGTPAVMPSEDFEYMSDQELSDVVTYIRSMPPVDAEVPKPTWGPVGRILLATSTFALSADKIPHDVTHEALPPAEAPDAAYGKHVAQVCTGCHRAEFNGGPMQGGDPSWPPVANITPHEQGLAGWTFEDFETAMRTGRSKDGSEARMPMSMVVKYTAKLTDTEMKALWAFLQTVPAQPDGT